MDWNSLAPSLVRLGAPMLGQVLGGPLGGAAGKILADAFGAAEPTPAALSTAIDKADPVAATQAAQAAEERWLAALAEIGRAQVAETGATMRAEIGSEDMLQRWWRPLYALELSLIECPAFVFVLLAALWSGHEAGINGFANLSGMLMAYFAARFGVLGVYVTGRTREKQAVATGELAPSVIGEIVKAVRGRK